MKRTSLSLTVVFLLFAAAVSNAQTDVIYGVNTNGSLIKIQINPVPGTMSSIAEVGSHVLNSGAPTANNSGSAADGVYKNYVYYVPYGNSGSGNGSGSMDIRSVKTDGSNDVYIGDIDLNGNSDFNNLGFVRLGFDKNGIGWIVAKGNDNKFYIGKFQANNTGGIVSGTLKRVGTFTVANGANYGSGDLAFDQVGNMFLLLYSVDDVDTRIYVIPPSTLAAHTTSTSNSNISNPQWIVKKPDGTNFTDIVNGIAFASDGSLYLSTASTLYYVDHNTVNNPAPGQVKVFSIGSTGRFPVHDLATAEFPTTKLPVEFSGINATYKNGQLSVNWQSLTETGMKEFVIEGTTDGENWKPIATIASKAPGGNSNQALDYQYIGNIAGSVFAGLGFALLFMPFFKSRIARVIVIIVMIGVAIGCSKNAGVGDGNNIENLWIRIVQHDLDGGSTVSKSVKVINQ